MLISRAASTVTGGEAQLLIDPTCSEGTLVDGDVNVTNGYAVRQGCNVPGVVNGNFTEINVTSLAITYSTVGTAL